VGARASPRPLNSPLGLTGLKQPVDPYRILQLSFNRMHAAATDVTTSSWRRQRRRGLLSIDQIKADRLAEWPVYQAVVARGQPAWRRIMSTMVGAQDEYTTATASVARIYPITLLSPSFSALSPGRRSDCPARPTSRDNDPLFLIILLFLVFNRIENERAET